MPAPQKLGKYQIRREIGKGSMGVVYEGFDPLIERRVAIKVVRPDEFDGGQLPELLARLKREAQAAGRLSHPGIVSIYDYGEDTTLHGSPVAYIAMELVDSGDLKSLLDAGHRFSTADVARLMRAILDALRHAHERGVTHRDVKPGNVMLLPDGGVKIADFGIAHLENSELTRAGTVVGTPQYMAPEQLLGLPVDGRADLFACGVILYQLLTGTKPFSGSYATVVQKVLNEEPAAPTTINQALAPAWDAVVRRAMAKKPAERFQSAAEFAAAVASAAAADDPAEATIALPRADEPVGPKSRRSWHAIGVGVALGAVALVALLTGRPTPDTAAPAQGPASVAAPTSTSTAATPAAWTDTPARASAPMATPAPAPIPATASASIRPVEPTPTKASTIARTAAASEAARTKAPAAPLSAHPEPSTPRAIAAAPPPATSSPVTTAHPWSARLAAVESARGRLTLPEALTLLLDIQQAEDRRKLQTVDALVRQQGPHTAWVIGLLNGYLAFGWRAGTSVEQAREAAFGRCRELRATGCTLVMVDAELRRPALLDVAAGLGARSVADVREAVLRVMDRATAALIDASHPPRPRETPATAVPDKPTTGVAPPVRPPDAAPAPAPPAREWADAKAALHAAAGASSLAGALTILLDVRSSDDLATLVRFEALVKRLQWKSALAMGEKNGHIQWGWSSRQANTQWASEGAINGCSRVAAAPCVVVMADGRFNQTDFMLFATRLGGRPQSQVREALIRSLQKRLEKGF